MDTGSLWRWGCFRIRVGVCTALASIAITSMFATTAALAESPREWSLDVNGLSKHSESRYDDDGVSREYNETNLGLGASIDWREWRDLVRRSAWTQWIDDAGIDADLKIGFFDNSYDDTSFYAGSFFHKDLGSGNWRFAPGVTVLLMSGYDDTPEDAPTVFPIAVFGLEVGHRALKLNIGYVPWGEVDVATVQLQLVPGYW